MAQPDFIFFGRKGNSGKRSERDDQRHPVARVLLPAHEEGQPVGRRAGVDRILPGVVEVITDRLGGALDHRARFGQLRHGGHHRGEDLPRMVVVGKLAEVNVGDSEAPAEIGVARGVNLDETRLRISPVLEVEAIRKRAARR